MSATDCTYKVVSAQLAGSAIANANGGGARIDARAYEARPGANASPAIALDTVNCMFSVESEQPQAFITPGTKGTSNAVLKKVGAGAGNVTVALPQSVALSGSMEFTGKPHRWNQEAQYDNEGTETLNPFTVS